MPVSVRPVVAAAVHCRSEFEWEDAACPLCSGEYWSPVLEAHDPLSAGGMAFTVVRCLDCGLCFTNPRPTASAIGQFYPADYRPHLPQASREPGFWRTLFPRSGPRSMIRRQLVPRRARGRLLDFGCGSGTFLEEMHRCGWRVTGLDVSPAAVQMVRTERGLSALEGSLPHPELRDARFDLITMWHSLEHVHAPLDVLREAHRLLSWGGQLVVAVPNIDSVALQWFGRNWYGLDLPRHLTHFAPWTLQLMLERAGFRVRSLRQQASSAWLRWSVRLAGASPMDNRFLPWLRWTLPSRVAAVYTRLLGRADCILATAER